MKKIFAVLFGTILILSACAGDSTSSSEDPKGALVDALRGLLQSDALTQTITLDSDADSLAAVSDGDINADIAEKILDSSITTSATQAENPEDAASLTVVTIAGTDAIEARFVDGDLYARVDVASLFETFGEDPAQLEALTAQVKGQPGFEWVEPAVAGEWVVVKDAVALTQQMGGTTFSGDQQKQLVEDLLASIQQNATVTDEGEDDNGEHVRASMPIRAMLEDLIKALGPGAGMAGAGMQGAMNDVPDGDLLMDFWISDGRVSRIEVDITQFEDMAKDAGEEFPEGVEELTVVVDIDDFTGEVEPVADAIEIDTAALGQAFSGLMTGGFGGGGAPGGSQFDCDQLKGAPPEVVELYAEECPELQKN